MLSANSYDADDKYVYAEGYRIPQHFVSMNECGENGCRPRPSGSIYNQESFQGSVYSNFRTIIDDSTMNNGWDQGYPLFVLHNLEETFHKAYWKTYRTIRGNKGRDADWELFDSHNLSETFQFQQVCVELFGSGRGFT